MRKLGADSGRLAREGGRSGMLPMRSPSTGDPGERPRPFLATEGREVRWSSFEPVGPCIVVGSGWRFRWIEVRKTVIRRNLWDVCFM